MSAAIAENQRALELDPLSLPINNFMGMTYMFAGKLRKGLSAIPAHHRHGPTFPLAHQYFSWLPVTIGRYEESIEENQKSELLGGSSPEDAAAEAARMLQAFKTRTAPSSGLTKLTQNETARTSCC
jgi:hypothetical protein